MVLYHTDKSNGMKYEPEPEDHPCTEVINP